MVTNLQQPEKISQPRLGNQSTLILSVALPRVVSNAAKFLEILRDYEPTQPKSTLDRIHILLGAEGLATLSAMTLAQRQYVLREYLPETKYTSQQIESMQEIAERLGERHDSASPAALFVQAFSGAANLEAEIEPEFVPRPLAVEPRTEQIDSVPYRVLSGQEKPEDISTVQKAVENYRKLAEEHPEDFLPHLAGNLNNLGVRYSELGRREEALQATLEAVDIMRELAKARPNAFFPYLAGSLNNLGNMYSKLGQREDALAVARESVQLYTPLVQRLPAAFMQDFLRSLQNLTERLVESGIRPESDPTWMVAFALLQQLLPDGSSSS